MFCWTRGVQGASTGAARPQRARVPVHAWAQPIGANVLGWCDSSGEGKKHDAGQGREPWSDAPVRAQKAKALRTRVHVNRAHKISPNSWVIRRSLISSLPLLTLVARALLRFNLRWRGRGKVGTSVGLVARPLQRMPPSGSNAPPGRQMLRAWPFQMM